VSDALRGTNRPPASSDGCYGCHGAVADVYVTVGCAAAGAGETYCWRCVDGWPADWMPLPMTVADVSVFPGREREV
jgi:hypothetical protein